MSGKISGMIWDLDLPHAEAYVLLAMADHADHEGNNVYPSVGLIAWKTNYSERQVYRVISELRRKQILLVVETIAGQVVKYRIDLSKAPLKPARVPKHTPDIVSGETITAPPNPRHNGRDPSDTMSGGSDTMSSHTHDTMSEGDDILSEGDDIAMSGGDDIAMSPKPSLNRQYVNRQSTDTGSRARAGNGTASAETNGDGDGKEPKHEETLEEARARTFIEYGFDKLVKK